MWSRYAITPRLVFALAGLAVSAPAIATEIPETTESVDMIESVAGTEQPNATEKPDATAGPELRVQVNFARLYRMPKRVSTIVIGNPAIADVTIQRSGIAVVTGKAYGSTNMILLDGEGNSLREQTILVSPRDKNTVTVQRALERETLACLTNSTCERTIKAGDASSNFDAATGQASAANGFATSAAPAAGR